MDVTFILTAVIFTLLAIAVATSMFSGSPPPTKSPAVDDSPATSCLGDVKEDNAGLDASGRPGAAARPDGGWTELSGSSHDHWEVVRAVLSGESESHHDNDTAEQPETLQPQSTSADSMRCVRPSKSQSCELESPSVAPSSSFSSEGGRRSLIGLSEKELLKCAFSYPQTEGDPGSPGFHDMQYLPGKVRSKHMESMMSKQELEEEQRVQREQLAAIFQLLQDNKETFGEVSEGDLEDQFRLYSN